MKPVKENPHKDHRSRVKDRFLRFGLDSFAPHEVLELMLFYAVPQKDTNELAHRLLDRFGGTLGGVLHAELHELCEVEGVGEHVATLLKLWLPAASCALTEENRKENKTYNRLEGIGEYFVRRYIGETSEVVYLMLLDNRHALIDCVRVHEGSVNSVGITPRRLLELAYRAHASAAVLAHNHPSGIAIPSGEDICTTISLREAFESMGVTLLEHILVAGGRYTPVLLHTEKSLLSAVDRREFYGDLLGGEEARP